MKIKRKSTARRNSWKYKQKSWTVIIKMAHVIIWHVAAAAAEREGVHDVSWRRKTMTKNNRWFKKQTRAWWEGEMRNGSDMAILF